jgi:hypothetical protein
LPDTEYMCAGLSNIRCDGFVFCSRLRYEAGGRPISYNNNCDSTQRLSGNIYGEIQQGSKLDDPQTVIKNQVSVPCSHLKIGNDYVYM